mmetsp:Transcript_47154/g.111996  ORF Transcript_47154/g.111996 Transcript_47154/m.111996 type:complete len:200 (-) Transcript_47154:663-1262(-)
MPSAVGFSVSVSAAMSFSAMGPVAPVPMLLRAVGVMAIAVAAMAAMATVALVATVSTVPELRRHLGVLLNVLIDEVADVVRTNVAQLGNLDLSFHRRQDLGILVDVSDPILDSDGLLWCYQVELVEDDLVCKGDLLEGFIHLSLFDCVIQTARQVLGVRHRDHSIQSQICRDLRAGHEGSNNGNRVGHARSLDHDLVNS